MIELKVPPDGPPEKTTMFLPEHHPSVWAETPVAHIATGTAKPDPAGEWWRGAVIYDAYGRCFCDSKADGQGDFRRLVAGMDYLASLGVDAVRLMPVLPSPNFDLGYDVADYYGSGPAFGTMDDFHYVGAETHVSGLKVIPDQVCSHSSHLHPWFIENAVLRGKPRVDWYDWADPRPDGGPPHNWLGRFGGFASEWNSTRKQCYLHNFLIDKPDLNLHNPEVQQAIHPVMRH